MQTNIKNTGYAWPIQCPSIRRKMCRKYLYDNVMFDSSPEIAYYIWLKDHNIDFVFHPSLNIPYFDKDKNLHYYEPDFLIVETHQLEDIKGKQFFKENVSFKLSYEYLACLKNNNVRLILEDEYMIYIDYCAKKFGCKKWYLKFKYHKSSK